MSPKRASHLGDLPAGSSSEAATPAGSSGGLSECSKQAKKMKYEYKSVSKSNGKTLSSIKAENEKVQSEFFEFDQSLSEFVVKQSLNFASEEEKAALKAKWKEIHFAELKIIVMKAQLLNEHAKLILEALKDSDR